MQNHWTMKYVTIANKYYEVTHSVILNQYPKYDVNSLNMFEILSKTTEPWNIGRTDLEVLWGHS